MNALAEWLKFKTLKISTYFHLKSSWPVVVVLLLLGAPLFIVIGSFAYLSYKDVPLDTLGGGLSFNTFFSEIMDKLAASSLFITIPFFAFAGFLLAESGAPKRLVNICRCVLGWLPGGLGIVAIFTCALFTAFTGASGVTIIALGGLLYPALAQDKYPEEFRLGLLTTCGSLGLLFPPSLPLILYALVASNSVDPNFFPGKERADLMCDVKVLFKAGIVPGILLIVILATYTVYVHHKVTSQERPDPGPEEKKKSPQRSPAEKAFRMAIFLFVLPFTIIANIYINSSAMHNIFLPIVYASVGLTSIIIYRKKIWRTFWGYSWSSLGRALWDAIYEVPLPFLIIGGIYFGYLTVDHASCLLVAYVFIVEVFLYRDIPLRKIPKIVEKAMALVGAILIILCMAIGYSNYLVHQHIPTKILAFMQIHLYKITLALLLNLGVLLLVFLPLFFLTKKSWQARMASIALCFLLVIILTMGCFSEGSAIQSLVPNLENTLGPTMSFLIVLNFFLLIVGCLMDIFSAILVVVPIIVPLAYKFNINPYHLGIIFLTNLEIGYSTPPVGINLFISSLRFRKPILKLYTASIPFIILLLIALALITYIPAISLLLV